MGVSGFARISSVDEDGFVCLVAAGPYEGFVGEDWELGELLTRFAEQINRGALFVVYAGPEAAGGELRIVAEASSERASREVVGVIDAGDGVWLTDYTQLTMAAQFDDMRPEPEDPESRLLRAAIGSCSGSSHSTTIRTSSSSSLQPALTIR